MNMEPEKNGNILCLPEITVYAAEVSPLNDEAVFRTAYSMVTRERQERADRYVFRKDKNLCVAAELLLRKALSEIGGGLSQPDFFYGKYGKPYLKGENMPFFSLSHSGDYAVCAVGGTELGCDIEKIGTAGLDIAKRFFSEGEAARIVSAGTEEESAELFCRFWTLKESFIKAAGLGLSMPLDSFEIGILPDGAEVLRKSVPGEFALVEFGDIPGYRLSVCALTEGKSFSGGSEHPSDGGNTVRLTVTEIRELL